MTDTAARIRGMGATGAKHDSFLYGLGLRGGIPYSTQICHLSQTKGSFESHRSCFAFRNERIAPPLQNSSFVRFTLEILFTATMMKRSRQDLHNSCVEKDSLKRRFVGRSQDNLYGKAQDNLYQPPVHLHEKRYRKELEPPLGASKPQAPVYSAQSIVLDQMRLDERRRYDLAIAKMEAEKQVYLKELHYLQMSQARGGPLYSTYVY